MASDDVRTGRGGIGHRWACSGISVVLLLGALVALWIALTQFYDWRQRSAGTFAISVGPWMGWLVTVVVAGFLFGLAARRPRNIRYRIGLPLLLGIVPALMLAHMLLLFGFELSLPGILNRFRFYMSFEAQFALAILLGVALASGFVDRDAKRSSLP